MHLYRFAPGYGGTGFCNEYFLGATGFYGIWPASITLCPRTFGTSHSRKNKWSYKSLRQITPQPTTNQAIISAKRQEFLKAQSIREFYPTAGTLFHELFHLVLGESFLPKKGEVYNIVRLLKMKVKAALKNPESYVIVAIAYDYMRNSQPNEAGDWIEFDTGYAAQG